MVLVVRPTRGPRRRASLASCASFPNASPTAYSRGVVTATGVTVAPTPACGNAVAASRSSRLTMDGAKLQKVERGEEPPLDAPQPTQEPFLEQVREVESQHKPYRLPPQLQFLPVLLRHPRLLWPLKPQKWLHVKQETPPRTVPPLLPQEQQPRLGRLHPEQRAQLGLLPRQL